VDETVFVIVIYCPCQGIHIVTAIFIVHPADADISKLKIEIPDPNVDI
jgi:hypothetical protein